MTPREMQSSFEYAVNMYDSSLIIESDLIFHWLNEAQELQVVTHYTGNNPYEQGFEQIQKRIDDLQALVKESELTTDLASSTIKPNSYTVSLPTDYMFIVDEEASIAYQDGFGQDVNKIVGVYPTTLNKYTQELSDPFAKHKLHYGEANPLRLIRENVVELISDGNYSIPTYIIRYISKPSRIYLGGPDCELPEYMQSHIVDKAVNLYLESIKDERYNSTKAELSDKE